MKKKLALLMAAIMTVAMVPMTAFASTKLTAVDEISTSAGDKHPFTSTVELSKNDDQVDVDTVYELDGTKVFDVQLKLTNGKFAKSDKDGVDYVMEEEGKFPNNKGVKAVDVTSDTTAVVSLNADVFNKNDTNGDNPKKLKACVLDITAYAVETGDVIAEFSSNVTQFKKASEVIATAYAGDVTIETEGVKTFVEDESVTTKEIKAITINGLVNGAVKDNKITLKLKGNWEYASSTYDGSDVKVSFLNGGSASAKVLKDESSKDTLVLELSDVSSKQLTKMTISGIKLKATKSCNAGDVAKITVSSKDFDSVTLEVAKMVAEAVTYTVEDKKLPTIWAGKNYANDMEKNTLELAIEENTGDILNTSRKATFTFPDGIEVVDAMFDGVEKDGNGNYKFKYQIDGNVVTIWNYGKKAESSATDMKVKFILNAAPTFSGDVKVKLGGEFDDVELKVATVKAPYTVEAKTSEVLIDYRYVPVNQIVITEAEDGLLREKDVITLEVEKMNFENAGKYEVTSGDIEVDVNIDEIDKSNILAVTVKDESTEASTITISGLELYLDRTLPVGGYALKNIMNEKGYNNILWENSTTTRGSSNDKAYDYVPDENTKSNGLFKYSAVTVNDSYVDVITAARDQDDSTTTRKIVITIGATTMAVGTDTVTLDSPAYINTENYTELPLRAVSEAFGATVGWDDASRTVTIMMGQRIVSMTIGSKTMYINGTPVAMNTAPEITNSRTFVPVRDLANALGITKIDWNEASATVTLN